jgi:hypothetical protein
MTPELRSCILIEPVTPCSYLFVNRSMRELQAEARFHFLHCTMRGFDELHGLSNDFGHHRPKQRIFGPAVMATVLVATHRKRYGGNFHANVGGELPERFAVALMYRGKAAVWLTVGNQTSGVVFGTHVGFNLVQ